MTATNSLRATGAPGHPPLPPSEQQMVWPAAPLRERVEQLAGPRLRELFAAAGGSSSSGGGKEARAAALTQLRSQLLRDLRSLGLIPDEGSAGQAAAAAAPGMFTREAALWALDLLESQAMREQLLQARLFPCVRDCCCTG